MIGLDISDADVYAGVAAFIALIVPKGTPIQQGQQNRVAMPTVSCVILTTIGVPTRIGTNAETIEAVIEGNEITGFTVSDEADFEYAVQADFYWATPAPPNTTPPLPQAEAWAMATELAWRSKWGWYAMPAGMKPLYSEGRQQLPIVGAENQWIQRWTLTLYLDYQPTLTLPTEAATEATVTPEPIDVYFPDQWTADSDLSADAGIPN